MTVARLLLVSLIAVAACSKSRTVSKTAEVPCSHAYSETSDGWWQHWDRSAAHEAPFGPGTQFETETLGPNGIRETEVLEVASITARPGGGFAVVLKSSVNGMTRRGSLPPDLLYSPGSRGVITTRNEQLFPVTVPAGTFSAGRLWASERQGSLSYERDEWIVPDVPVRIQSWSRPVNAADLYNPPADGVMPEGTVLTRLVRIDRK